MHSRVLTSLSAKPTENWASTPLIRPRLDALSFVMRIHIRVSAVPATATMIDAYGDTLLARALHDAKRRPREPSRMPFDDDDDASGIERRWWAAPFHSKRLFTQHRSVASHIPLFAMQCSSLSLSLLLFSLTAARSRSRGCETRARWWITLSSCSTIFFLFVPFVFVFTSLSLYFSLSSSSFNYLAHPRLVSFPISVTCLSFVVDSCRKRFPDTFPSTRRWRCAGGATHFPLFPLFSLSLPLLFLNSLPPVPFPRMYNCTRARIHTHISTEAPRA